MGGIASLLFVLLYLALASAAILSSTPNGIRLHTNTSSTLSAQSRHDGFDRVTYLVPHTSTFIDLLITHFPLRPVDVEIVLAAIEVQLSEHIKQEGDGPLEPEDDPYEFGLPGCQYSTKSADKNSLSYGVLKNTIKGLQTLVVDGKRFFRGLLGYQ